MSEELEAENREENRKKETFLTRGRKKIRRWRHGLLPSTSYSRLAVELKVNGKNLDSQIEQLTPDTPGGSSNLPLLSAAREMLREAETALGEGSVELGWGLLKASNRSLIYAMPEGELASRAHQILRESSDKEKAVSAWRRDAIRELLASADGKLKEPLKLNAEKVAQAAQILDVHYDNVYQKLSIVRGRLVFLAVMTFLALISWLVVLPLPADLTTRMEKIDGSPWFFWATIFLSGVTGALISGFTSSLTKRGGASRIPTELDFTSIMFARLALGALSALAVTIFLTMGLLKLGELSYGLMLAVTIVSGFSERLLLRALESAAAG